MSDVKYYYNKKGLRYIPSLFDIGNESITIRIMMTNKATDPLFAYFDTPKLLKEDVEKTIKEKIDEYISTQKENEIKKSIKKFKNQLRKEIPIYSLIPIIYGENLRKNLSKRKEEIDKRIEIIEKILEKDINYFVSKMDFILIH